MSSLASKVAVVTGASSGIGLATAEALASRGARVILVGRDGPRIQAALDKVGAVARLAGGPEPRAELADFARLTQVAALADRLKTQEPRLDLLVNVAGVFTSSRALTPEGLETQFAVNHLAPMLLTTRLLPLLEASGAAKVVTVSSDSHYYGWIRWKDPFLTRRYFGLWAYEQSKLANVLFSAEFARRLGPASGVEVLVADPGLVDTAMGEKHGPSVASLFWSLRRRGGTPASVPAEAIAFLAEASKEALGGQLYWKNKAAKAPARRALREADGARLWALSEAYIAQALGGGGQGEPGARP